LTVSGFNGLRFSEFADVPWKKLADTEKRMASEMHSVAKVDAGRIEAHHANK
jgi:hypothetical protein